MDTSMVELESDSGKVEQESKLSSKFPADNQRLVSQVSCILQPPRVF